MYSVCNRHPGHISFLLVCRLLSGSKEPCTVALLLHSPPSLKRRCLLVCSALRSEFFFNHLHCLGKLVLLITRFPACSVSKERMLVLIRLLLFVQSIRVKTKWLHLQETHNRIHADICLKSCFINCKLSFYTILRAQCLSYVGFRP